MIDPTLAIQRSKSPVILWCIIRVHLPVFLANVTPMTRVLLTAFEPYDRWTENASWLALIDLTSWYDGPAEIITRRYPVELTQMSEKLREDLHQGFDLAIHVGQSPGSTQIKLEAVGLNLRTDGSSLIESAPEAYRSPLPLEPVTSSLNEAGIPAAVSHHAGTYLCNASLYLSQHYSAVFGMATKSVFIHLPLTPAQAAKEGTGMASMSSQMSSAAIAMTVTHLLEHTCAAT